MALSPERTIKVVRIITRLNIGGPAVHVMNLHSGLDPARFRQIMVCGSENPGEGSMLDVARSRGIQPVLVPEMVGEASIRPRDLRAIGKLYRLMRQVRPHIVDSHTAKAGFLGRIAARAARVPVVVHTYHGHVLHGYYSRPKSYLLRRMERGLGLLSTRLIAVSELVKLDLVKYGVAPAGKIEVIPLGLELGPFLDCGSKRGEFRSELGMVDGAPLVGIVGRIFAIKNHRLFLDAASRVAADRPDARFVVVGDGALRGQMEDFARQAGLGGKVVFSGWRRDLPCIYADLDVLVVSSNNEGTPVSAIEAMASGCPVVSTRVGGVPDVVSDGKTGYLVSPGRPDELSSAILRVLRDPGAALQMGLNAREAAAARFSVQRLSSDTAALYERLLAERGLSV